ncbi:MAG TPA: hypothetical protein DEO70_14165 [Bacteroidales bacterium]|nr:MAG: hypothetical protein A2X11_13510 [Bacteroidetes bacterium GWE2_42_24]OFY26715.1 MAG: hypothetical protein A2X09_09920 [Bacteroidetes bacterium GWF2_43_11]HBZ67975.1 hypothetical protein [Bacteroidales bacterium]
MNINIKILGLILITVYIFTNTVAEAQVTPLSIQDYSILDSAGMEISYRVETMNDSRKPDKKTPDIQKLLIGRKISKIYSCTLFYYDSLATVLIAKGAQNYPICQSPVMPVEVIKDFSKKTLSVIYRTLTEDLFLYEEQLPEFNWIIQPEKKTILTHMCQKALTSFRGRNYEAWFAPDLPFPDGPFKFSGLPGLILEIRDTQGHYSFQCIGIKKLKPAKPIALYDWPYNRTTREELNAFLIKMHNDPFGYFKSKGQTLQMIENGKEINKPKDYWPYNPVETE